LKREEIWTTKHERKGNLSRNSKFLFDLIWGTCHVSWLYIFNHVVSSSWHAYDKSWGNLKPHVHFFYSTLWFRWTLSEVFLCQSSISHAESKFVQPHMSLVRACSIVYDSSQLISSLGQALWLDFASNLDQCLSCVMLHLISSSCCHLGSQQHSSYIMMSSQVMSPALLLTQKHLLTLTSWINYIIETSWISIHLISIETWTFVSMSSHL